MVGLSRLAGGGLLLVLALLPLALDGQPAAPPQELHKAPAAPTAPSRIMRAAWDRMVQPEPHAEGAGSGDSSRPQQQDNRGRGGGCFDRRIDRISHSSDMGCRHHKRPPAAPTAPSRIIRDLRPDSKQSQAA